MASQNMIGHQFSLFISIYENVILNPAHNMTPAFKHLLKTLFHHIIIHQLHTPTSATYMLL